MHFFSSKQEIKLFQVTEVLANTLFVLFFNDEKRPLSIRSFNSPNIYIYILKNSSQIKNSTIVI